MDTPYVREYVEDREITAWFLLDLSPSVDFGTVESERLKRSVLVDFVTTLARLLTRHGNRVGAVFYGSRVERTIPARGGRIQVLRLINDLLRQPRLPRAPFTDLAPLLEAGQHAIKRRSLVFVISDFISAPGWERPLNLLTQRHEVLAVRLFDRREVELPDVGAADHGGRRDRRAALRRHPRQGLPAAVPGRRASGARRRCATRSSGPASTPCRSRPTRTWSRAIVRMATLRQKRRTVTRCRSSGRRCCCSCWRSRSGRGPLSRARAPSRGAWSRSATVAVHAVGGCGRRTRPGGIRRRIPAALMLGGPGDPASWRSPGRRPWSACRGSRAPSSCLRRLGQHGRRRPGPDPDGGGQGGRPDVRRAPADVGPDRGRRVQRQRLLDPGADERRRPW